MLCVYNWVLEVKKECLKTAHQASSNADRIGYKQRARRIN